MNASISVLNVSDPEWMWFPIYSSLSPLDLSILAVGVVLYMVGLVVALFLVAVILWDTRLQRPVHVLLGHLSVSGALGGSTLCPVLVRFLVEGMGCLPLTECLMQAFFVNLYSGCMFLLLGLMALDRYVAVCFPLQYHMVVTPGRLRTTLLSMYSFLATVSVVQAILTSRVRLCSFSMDKLLCESLTLSRLACQPNMLVSAFGLFCSFSVIIFPCCVTVFSYVQIFIVVVRNTKDSQRKAFRTCTPHFITFANFSLLSFFGVISRRVNDSIPKTATIVVTLVFLVFPPLLNPIVYGIKTTEIQTSIRRALFKV